MRRNPDIGPLGFAATLLLGGGVAWYALKWWQARSAPPPAGAGSGDMCKIGTHAATLGASIAAGAAAGLPALPYGPLVGAIGGTVAGLARIFAAQRECDKNVCADLQVAYNNVIARGQGGGRIARLVHLVNKAQRRNETCNGMTATAGMVVGT